MKNKLLGVLKYTFLIFLLLFEAIPILQVYINSFRSNADVKTTPFGLPKEWLFNNVLDTWRIGEYGVAFVNSIIISAAVILTVLIIVGLGAYALSKLEFRGKDFFIAYFFVAISLPSFLYIVPDYFMLNKLGMINTHLGLIILYTAMYIPFNMLLLRTFLTGIPREVEEAAKIDGCSELAALLRITLPIAKTVFMTIALLTFVSVWNEFLWANTFINNEGMKTVATRAVKFIGEHTSDMSKIYAASAISITPVIVLYLAFSQKFIEGMTSGSVKG